MFETIICLAMNMNPLNNQDLDKQELATTIAMFDFSFVSWLVISHFISFFLSFLFYSCSSSYCTVLTKTTTKKNKTLLKNKTKTNKQKKKLKRNGSE